MIMLGDAFGGQGEQYTQFWEPVFDLREYDPDVPLDLGAVSVRFAATQHFVECYAMRFENSRGRSIGYSADTGAIEPLVPLLSNCDIAVIEATLDSYGNTPPEMRGHITPGDAGRLAAMSGSRVLVLTHLWSERPGDGVVRAARTEFRGDIHVAVPGLSFNV